MLSRLCFKPSTSKIFSIKEDEVIQILPIPMILPLPLSPNVTLPPSITSRDVNCFTSPVMCLEQPLSKYQRCLFSLVARHTCKNDQVFALGTHVILGPFGLVEVVPFGTQTLPKLLEFLCKH